MAFLRFEALTIEVESSEGLARRELLFSDGLNILRADNSSGKSTALQAMIYGLGLEGMLSPTSKVPLPHAVTDSIALGGVESRVLRSSVKLRIRNAEGRVIEVSRSVVGPKDRRLIEVRHLASSRGQADSSESYFVRMAGAAQREAGFHRFFADFMGMELPKVSKMDGAEVPLYLETLFPFFYVEQKHGWTGVQARVPNYYRIREVARRSAEYVLGLEVLERVLLEQRLRANLAQLEGEWQLARKAIEVHAKDSQYTVLRLQSSVAAGWAEDRNVPSLWLNGKWLTLDAALAVLESRLAALPLAVPTVGAVVADSEKRLPGLVDELNVVIAQAQSLMNERFETEARREQASLRVQALEEDLQRHRDALKLVSLGSTSQLTSPDLSECPTCHQSLQDGSDVAAHPMTAEQNIAFIKRQIALFSSMHDDLDLQADLDDVKIATLTARSQDLREEIRAIKDLLVSANSALSVAEVRARVQLEERIANVRVQRETFAELRSVLKSTTEGWQAQRDQLNALTDNSLSGRDRQILALLEQGVQGKLTQFGFKSLEPSSVAIDESTYRPSNEGYDLGFDVSASDMIRVIWAYLLSLLEVGPRSGNHPGFLIFDEPRQQETAKLSFAALLRGAADLAESGAQILFATSEDLASLNEMMAGKSYNLMNIESNEKLLKPDSGA